MQGRKIEEHVSQIQQLYQSKLASAAIDYLSAGLKLFHNTRIGAGFLNPQASIGNLATSVELMLKSFIASKHITLLFKGLPLEVHALLTCPDSLPDNFNWRPYNVELVSAKYETRELEDCIKMFYIFFPKWKQQLAPHLRFLRESRNSSIHSLLPPFHQYELERTAYVALRLYEILEGARIFGPVDYTQSKSDKKFMAEFQEEKLHRVQKAVESAKERAKVLVDKTPAKITAPNRWGSVIRSCPICGSDAILIGSTELSEYETDNDGDTIPPDLFFWSDSFSCSRCGLILNDDDEMKLAGFSNDQIVIDRTEELDEYLKNAVQI